ncbi:aminotransferase class III-fold pyridoxal phosphate-dependent enzyme, partial [Mesorhizobium sp. M7A.F.Ca.US.001.04.2.1]
LKVGSFCSQKCQNHGLIIRNMGDIIAFCPPLIISEPEIDEMFRRFELALAETWQMAKANA